MSFQSLVLEKLAQINTRLNLITTKARKIWELPVQSTLTPTSLLHVSNNQTDEQLELQKLLDYFETLGYLRGEDIFQFNTVLQSSYRWIENYKYEVVWVKAFIFGEIRTFTFNSEITLSTPDATFNRKDVIVLNIQTETLEVIQGTPASEPSAPPLAENQLLVTIIDVDAGTTAPNNVTNEDVYLNNAEWTSSVTGNFDANNTNNPDTGDKSIYINSAIIGNNVQLQRNTEIATANVSSLVFRIYVSTNSNPKLLIEASNNSQVLGTVLLQHNSYGFNKNLTNQWQTIIIPQSALNLVSGQNIRTIKFIANSNGIVGYIDNVILQYGTEEPNTNGDFLTRGGYEGTAQDLKDEIDAIGLTPGIQSVSGDGVNNTDPGNPILTYPTPAQISAIPSTEKGVNNGVATLDGAGKVPSAQLPDSVNPLFLGPYPSLSALNTVHPTASPGNYADVDAGVGNDVERYIWDADDNKFVKQGSGGGTVVDTNIIQYQNEITVADTTFDGTQKGEKNIYPFNSVDAQTLTIESGDYSINEVINIQRIHTGSLEIIQGNGVRFRGDADINGRFFIDAIGGIVSLICKGADEFAIIGNLKQGLNGEPKLYYTTALRVGDTNKDVVIFGDNLHPNMLVSITGNATLNSFTVDNNRQATLKITETGVTTDLISIVIDNSIQKTFPDALELLPAAPSNLISHYRFDDNLIDIVSGYKGINTAVTYVAGESGNKANFNGLNSKVIIEDNDVFSFGDGLIDSAFSIDLLVEFNSITFANGAYLVSKRGLANGTGSGTNAREYELIIENNDKVAFILWDNSTGGYLKATCNIPTVVLGTKLGICAAYSGNANFSGLSIKVNGVSQTLTDASSGTYTAMENTDSVLTIGKKGWQNPSGALDGSIEGLSIWAVERTEAQALADYNTRLAGNEIA